jgi:signal transduction histidine kinase
MMLLGAFLVVWWYQSFSSDRDQLRDAVETEVNRIINEDYVVHGLRAMIINQVTPQKSNITFEVSQERLPEWFEEDRKAELALAKEKLESIEGALPLLEGKPNRFPRGLRRDTPIAITTIPRVRVEQFEKNENGLPQLVTISVDQAGEESKSKFFFREDGVTLDDLPEMVNKAVREKFGVTLFAIKDGTAPKNLVVTARSIKSQFSGNARQYEMQGYARPLMLGLLPEFLFGFLLFGATGFSFATAYRNLRDQEIQLRQKDALVANVAHELKTPIATVGVALEALNLFGADDDPIRRADYLSIGQSELKRLDQMADRAIDSLQAGALDARLDKVEVDLEKVIQESWRGLRLRYELEDHQLQLDVHTNPVLWADPSYLFHLVYNLLDNACKYGGDPRDIRVVLTGGEASLSLAVADNGPGIPLAERNKVFERFYRIVRPDEGHRTKGHGLGLSFVRQIVDAHRGWISLENASPAGGALFTVELPRFDRP